MTTKTIVRPERVFRMGAIELADPSPTSPPEDVLKMYIPNYPHLSNSTLGEGFVEGDRLVYEILKPVVETKGMRHKSAE